MNLAVLLFALLFVMTGSANNGNGGGSNSTSGQQPPGQQPPKNLVAPSISGVMVAGQTLSASPGSWDGSGLSYAYQWLRCDTSGNSCAPLAGATGSAYSLTASDVGYTLRVSVTASNKNGSATATSAPTAVVAPPPTPVTSVSAPANTALPVISGSAVVGQTLSASTGTWSGSPTSYAYQWRHCDTTGANCVAVSGASSASYGLTSSDVGFTMRIAVTATNSGGSTTAVSAQSAVITTSVSAPANTALPVVSGSSVVGQTLSASTGTWSGSPTSYAYQWRHCDSAGAACANISGATSASYLLSSSDAGFTMRVAVTASNAGGSATAVSTQTAVVATVSATTSSAFPASFFTGPLGAKNILPTTGSGVLVGASNQGSFDQQKQQTLDRESYFGRKYDMIQIHYGAPNGACDYGQGYSPFTSGMEQWIDQRGSILVMSWTHGWTIDEVNQGYADNCLVNFGKKAAAFGKPFLLRIYWEFNGGTLRWASSGQPFIDAWRRTVSKIREGGGTNVGFIWNPDGGYRATAFSSYPGDAYVDWVGTSVYNFNNPNAWCGYHAGWCEFWETLSFDPVKYPAVYDVYANTKPFIVPEMGSKEDPYTPGRKGQWMLNARDAMKTKFPGVRAINYFDIDASTTEGGGRNWRLDTSQSSLDGFRSLAKDSYFNTR